MTIARIFVLGLSLGFAAFPAAAKTTVTRDGTTVTIHVPIEVEGLAGKRVLVQETGKPDQIADAGTFLQTDAMRIWNEAFSGVRWGDCLKFTLDLQLIPVMAGEHKSGRHRVILSARPGRPGETNTFWKDTGPDDQVPTRDFPFAFSRDMEGYWAAPDGEIVAHEVGHAMGLGDDYFVMVNDKGNRVLTGKKAEPELGEADSHMATHYHLPDSAIVFRILMEMQEAGVLPQCTRDLFTFYLWEGDIRKEFVQQANQDPLPKLTGKWVAEFHVKLVQVPSSSKGSYTHKDGTTSGSYMDDFYPLALEFNLVATYSETLPGNKKIEINGSATGRLRGDTLLKPGSPYLENRVPETDLNNDLKREGKWVRLPALKGMDRSTTVERLGGEMLRVTGDHPGNAEQQEVRNSDAQECAFYGDLPGDFRFTIDLGARGNGTEAWSDAEQQALLGGIVISGTNLYAKTAQASDVSQFQHLIRADICGGMYQADQKEVTGSRIFTVAETGGVPEQQGRLTWSFHRTARQIPYEKK